MAMSDWNLEASEEAGQLDELQHQKTECLTEAQYEEEWHERRHQRIHQEDTFEKIMDILSKDKDAQDMMTRLNASANASGLTKERYQKAKETVFLLAILNNPDAFQTLSDSVWNKINDHQVGADLARYMGV